MQKEASKKEKKQDEKKKNKETKGALSWHLTAKTIAPLISPNKTLLNSTNSNRFDDNSLEQEEQYQCRQHCYN